MKNLTILLTLIITSCAYIPDTLIVKDEGFKRDVRGEFILKTTKETNPYLGVDFVVNDIELALNPLPRLKEKPKVIYYQGMNSLIPTMTEIFNNTNKYKYVGYYSPHSQYNQNSKREMEEAGILLGANLLLVINFKEAKQDGKVEKLRYEVAFINTKGV